MGHAIGIETSYTGNPVSFTTANGGTMSSVSVTTYYTQDLHGYQGPWPGGGGVNIWDEQWELGTWGLSSGGKAVRIASSNQIRNKNLIPVEPSTEYRILTSTDTSGFFLVLIDDDTTMAATSLARVGGSTYKVFTTGGNTHWIGFSMSATYGTVYQNDIAVNYPSSVTTYSPYANVCPYEGLTSLSVYLGPTQNQVDATVYNSDWSAQAGTVYGSTVNVATGQLTTSREKYVFGNDLSWELIGTTNFSTYIGVGLTESGYNITENGVAIYYNANSGTVDVYLYLNAFLSTTSNMHDYMDGMGFIYTPTTPTTYYITPKTINALIGQNYIWASNNGTVSVVLNEQAIGFAGWLIKCVTNGVPVEIPLKYIRAETYVVTPDQRMEWSAERDVTGVLHRETVQNLPPKIEFNTPLMPNSEINALNSIIKAAFTNYLQRNITIQFYDPERDEYWEWDCYMPDVKYQIRNVDIENKVINYEELRFAFIGY